MDNKQEFKERELNGNVWSGYYQIEKKNDSQLKIQIKFETPIDLPICSSTNQAKIENIKATNQIDEQFLEEKLNSAFHEKYTSKLTDSYNTYIKMVAFDIILNEYTNFSNDILIEKLFDNNRPPIKITEEMIEQYVNQYIQYHSKIKDISREDIKKRFERIHLLTSSTKPKGLDKKYKDDEDFKKLKKAYSNYKSKHYKSHFEKNFPIDDFIEMLLQDKCEYCGVSIEQLNILRYEKNSIFSKSGRGFSLEIDRIEPNLEYTKDNCCMSCYWCNNAKTDEFSAKQFKKIARGINLVWNKRLQEANIQEKVCFPENSDIWDK